MRQRGYAHVKETASPLSITVEPNCAGHDASDDVNRDGEQICGSSTESELELGVSVDPTLNSLSQPIPC